MRCMKHTIFGEPADVLSLSDAAIPEPDTGQVRIKTILSPIHNHDLMTVRGVYGYKPELPAIGGTEAVGTVEALGPGVEGVVIGQRVAVAAVHGTWAEYFLAPAASLFALPDTISDEQGAQIIAMPFSALALLKFMELAPGDWIVQNAANGAVGKAIAMLGAARGVNVVSVVRRKAAIDELGELGIANIVSAESEGWQDRVRELTKGAPIKAGVDSIGGKASKELLALLGEDSMLVVFGSMTGEDLAIPAGELIYKNITVKGFWGSKVAAALGAEGIVRLAGELVDLVAQGAVKLPVEGIFSLNGIADAVNASLTPGKAGKVLLRP